MDTKLPPTFSNFEETEVKAKLDSPGSGIQFTRDANFLIGSFLPADTVPPPYPAKGLPLPLCLPQIASNYDSPFVRGYNAELAESVDISESQLLSFIDGLNLAIIASPPLRVVNMAGMALGFVPYHWAMIAGIVLQTASQTAMHVLSKTLTDRYLRAANLRLFKPRGLSVRLCTTAAMLHLVGAGTADNASGSSKGKQRLDTVGRAVGGVLLRLPIPFGARVVRAVSDKPPKIAPSAGPAKDSVIRRRLGMIEGVTMPLNLEVPPPEKAKGVMDTMSSWGVQFSQFVQGRKDGKTEQRRKNLERQEHGASRSGVDWDREESGGRRERRAERKHARRERKRKLADTLGVGLFESKTERRVAKADLIEHWATDKLLWIVVMASDRDNEINDIHIAESEENEERIDDKTWRKEVALEKEEVEDDLSAEEELLEYHKD